MKVLKKCFVCGIEKELSEFYKHNKMHDGHINKCKECTKKQSDEREKKLRQNPEWCEKEKQRSKEKYHRLNYCEKAKQKNKDKKWKTRQGNLRRVLKTKINISETEEIHHWNYDFLKDIFIIPKDFHRFIHTKLRAKEKLFIYKETDTILDTFDKHNLFLLMQMEIYKKQIAIRHYTF